MRILARSVLALIVLAALAFPSIGAPPANSTGQYKSFYESLRDKNNMPCCSISDCRPVQQRTTGQGYEVFIDDRFFEGKGVGWAAVPPEAFLTERDNPTGEPIACWSPYRGVMCFLRGFET